MTEIRPGMRGGPKSAHMRFIVPVDDRKRLVKIANKQRISMSQLMRSIIADYLEKNPGPKPR